MTISFYARRKGWPLEDVTVSLRPLENSATGVPNAKPRWEGSDRIEREIQLTGALTSEQRARCGNRGPLPRSIKRLLRKSTSELARSNVVSDLKIDRTDPNKSENRRLNYEWSRAVLHRNRRPTSCRDVPVCAHYSSPAGAGRRPKLRTVVNGSGYNRRPRNLFS